MLLYALKYIVLNFSKTALGVIKDMTNIWTLIKETVLNIKLTCEGTMYIMNSRTLFVTKSVFSGINQSVRICQ